MKKFLSVLLCLTLLLSCVTLTALAEEPTKLKVIHKWNGSNQFPFPVLDEIEKIANVDIEWILESDTDWAEKKNLILASGDLPDVFFGCGLSNGDVTSGVFMDLTPYLEAAPNVKKYFETYPDAKIMCTAPDGGIYGIPGKIALRPDTYDCMYINKTWLDKLGLEMPTTTDEYYEVLKAFVTQDPNGNGKADEIGYIAPCTGSNISTMANLSQFLPAFGVVVNYSTTYCMVKDGVVTFAPTMEGYKEAMKWLHKLYSEGLIDSEVFSMEWGGYTAKLRNPEAVTCGSSASWTILDAIGNDYLEHYAEMLPLKGPFGDQYWNSDPIAVGGRGNMFAIPVTCENPEAAIRLLDACMDEYLGFQLTYGSEGIGVGRDENGNPTFLKPAEGYTDGEWKHENGLDLRAPTWASPEFAASITGENEVFVKFDSNDRYAPYFLPESRYPTIFWDRDTEDELAILKTDINTYVDTMLVDFVMNGNVDERWDEYVSQLNAMGLDRLMEIYTKGYESTK